MWQLYVAPVNRTRDGLIGRMLQPVWSTRRGADNAGRLVTVTVPVYGPPSINASLRIPQPFGSIWQPAGNATPHAWMRR